MYIFIWPKIMWCTVYSCWCTFQCICMYLFIVSLNHYLIKLGLNLELWGGGGPEERSFNKAFLTSCRDAGGFIKSLVHLGSGLSNVTTRKQNVPSFVPPCPVPVTLLRWCEKRRTATEKNVGDNLPFPVSFNHRPWSVAIRTTCQQYWYDNLKSFCLDMGCNLRGEKQRLGICNFLWIKLAESG